MPFCESYIPPLNLEAPLVIGSTVLLPQFLSLCAASQQRTVFFTAPFYESTFMERLASNFDFRSVRVEIIVETGAVAELILSDLQQHYCQNFALYICARLHAKVYIFESLRGHLAALVGSHNPTVSGMSSNIEIGIVLRARPTTSNWLTITDLKKFLINRATPYTSKLNQLIVAKRS
jgi:phosphatidylserine/phosphatidylglycerophosphate/cardiolipin synthase-like enzyme